MPEMIDHEARVAQIRAGPGETVRPELHDAWRMARYAELIAEERQYIGEIIGQMSVSTPVDRLDHATRPA